jgi:hypothetical protein
MQLRQRRQMAADMEANDFRCDLFQEFARQRPLVHEVACEVANQVLSVAYLL